MLNMVIFLCIATVLISIFIGIVLYKEYTLIKYYIKRKELDDGIIQPTKNNPINNYMNRIPNQRHNLPAPKVIHDNKIYSQQEFSKEINSGKFQISPMLQSKLYDKNKQAINRKHLII